MLAEFPATSASCRVSILEAPSRLNWLSEQQVFQRKYCRVAKFVTALVRRYPVSSWHRRALTGQ